MQDFGGFFVDDDEEDDEGSGYFPGFDPIDAARRKREAERMRARERERKADRKKEKKRMRTEVSGDEQRQRGGEKASLAPPREVPQPGDSHAPRSQSGYLAAVTESRSPASQHRDAHQHHRVPPHTMPKSEASADPKVCFNQFTSIHVTNQPS